jgi:ribosomal protein L17
MYPSNLVTSLIQHEQVKTTLPKARDAARLAEKVRSRIPLTAISHALTARPCERDVTRTDHHAG